MIKEIITPALYDTDALGHINNCTVARWFEQARNPFFKMFMPLGNGKITEWNLIMARTEYNFTAEIFLGQDVEVRSFIEKIGNSSLTTYQQLWQRNTLCADGKSIMVHYDFENKCSVKIPEDIREKLSQHLK